MKVSIVILQICSLFTCHVIASGTRSKRTIGFFENIINTMRETFAPESPPLPPPDVIAKITKLPYSTHYTYYPSSVRMHIRPVEKHVIYVKPPSSHASIIIRPSPQDADVIRLVHPVIRMPKPRPGATIHYEIIPVPVSIHQGSPQSFGLPLSSANPAPVTETDELSDIPWSMDALPPPLPISKPTGNQEELSSWTQVNDPSASAPLNSQFWQPSADWPLAHADQPANQVAYPMVKKKLIVHPKPKNQQANPAFYQDNSSPFMPSPLHSEISFQPSLELASFSERHRRNHRSSAMKKTVKLRRHEKEIPIKRRRRNTKSTDNGNSPQATPVLSLSSSTIKYDIPTSLDARKFTKALFLSGKDDVLHSGSEETNFENIAMKSKTENFEEKLKNWVKPFKDFVPANNPISVLDFGEYTDNEDADKEDNEEANSNNEEYYFKYSDDSIKIAKSQDWLADSATDDFSSATHPKSSNIHSSQFLSQPSFDAKFLSNSRSTSPRFSTSVDTENKFSLFKKTSPGLGIDDFQRSRQNGGRWRSSFSSSELFSSGKPKQLKFNEEVSSTKLPSKESNNYLEDLFGPTEKSNNFGTGYFSNEKRNGAPHSAYDNIEYFEPIIIDIDKSSELARGRNFKNDIRNFVKAEEPLKMPTNLHKTVDILKKMSLHPPVFDLDGEGSEKSVAIIDKNKFDVR